MGPTIVGLLHPGTMGTEVGRILAGRGCTVLWCPDGRSPATLRRAQAAGFHPTSIGDLCRRAEVIVSLCPPHAVDDVARVVAAASFRGLYLEANAISPSYIGHRQLREQQIVDVLAAGPATIAEIVARVYQGLQEDLINAAAENVHAHLIKLKEEGRALASSPAGETALDERSATWSSAHA